MSSNAPDSTTASAPPVTLRAVATAQRRVAATSVRCTSPSSNPAAHTPVCATTPTPLREKLVCAALASAASLLPAKSANGAVDVAGSSGNIFAKPAPLPEDVRGVTVTRAVPEREDVMVALRVRDFVGVTERVTVPLREAVRVRVEVTVADTVGLAVSDFVADGVPSVVAAAVSLELLVAVRVALPVAVRVAVVVLVRNGVVEAVTVRDRVMLWVAVTVGDAVRFELCDEVTVRDDVEVTDAAAVRERVLAADSDTDDDAVAVRVPERVADMELAALDVVVGADVNVDEDD